MLTPNLFRWITFPKLYFDKKQISVVKEEKYLGYLTRSDLSDDAMINVLKCVYSRGNMLVRNLKMCDVNVNSKLVETFSSCFYCCRSSLWNNFKLSTLEKARVGYNNVFRTLLNLDRRTSISHIFVQYNVSCFPMLLPCSMFPWSLISVHYVFCMV